MRFCRLLDFFHFFFGGDTSVSSNLDCSGSKLFMPRLRLPRSSYDLFAYDFPYDFFGIVGGYKLRRMSLHYLRGYRTISVYLHDRPI